MTGRREKIVFPAAAVSLGAGLAARQGLRKHFASLRALDALDYLYPRFFVVNSPLHCALSLFLGLINLELIYADILRLVIRSLETKDTNQSRRSGCKVKSHRGLRITSCYSS